MLQVLLDGGYRPECVYNADETALYYRLLPDKTLASKTDNHKTEGYKQSKDRLTLLFAVNSTGSHKLPPLCIGKFRSPRCFKHVNMNCLPLKYDASKNSWMTAGIFHKWFHEQFAPAVKSHLRLQGMEEKAILLLDNCPAHPPAEQLVSGDITVHYLPKNTTSVIQPLDQGIIKNFKANYRKELMLKLVDSDKDVTATLKAMTVKDAIYLGGKAWSGVTSTAVVRCWRRGLGGAFELTPETNPQRAEEVQPEEIDFEGFEDTLTDLVKEVQKRHPELDPSSVPAWVECDSQDDVADLLSDIDIVTGQTQEPEEEGEEEIESPTPPCTTATQAVEAFTAGLRWLESLPDTTPVQILHAKSMLDKARQVQRANIRQKKLTSYFSQQ